MGIETFLLIKNNQCYRYANAVLEIAKDLSRAWPLLTIFKAVPRPARSFIYRLLGRNRYISLGKKDTCRVPSKAVRSRLMGVE